MTQIHTHYDNLKVARNAPHEVIRAAYKVLAQKLHPDRNPGNTEAARFMAIINASYEVLSDPDRRLEHDKWVAQQELIVAQANNANSPPISAEISQSIPNPHLARHNFREIDHQRKATKAGWIMVMFSWVVLVAILMDDGMNIVEAAFTGFVSALIIGFLFHILARFALVFLTNK